VREMVRECRANGRWIARLRARCQPTRRAASLSVVAPCLSGVPLAIRFAIAARERTIPPTACPLRQRDGLFDSLLSGTLGSACLLLVCLL